MQAGLESFKREIEAIDDVKELRRLLLALKKENINLANRESERLKAEKETSLLYKQMEDEVKGLRKENQTLKEKLSHIEDQNALKANSMFGRQTEKLSDLVNSNGDGSAPEDPLSEDADEKVSAESHDGEDGEPKNPDPEKNGDGKKKGGKRTKGKRARDLSKLPRKLTYEYDPKELDQIYGKGNWIFAGWHETIKKGYIPAIVYADVVKTPIVEVVSEHKLSCLPMKKMLLPGSDVTFSLLAGIYNHKFSLGLPLNRQECEFARFDTVLSRQTMDNWVIRFSHEVFFKVYKWMEKLLKKTGCTQSDETTLLVIRDGRKAGRKSFMWVHITSELVECHPIAIFCYEPDRSADHLREFYDDYVGKIICDAYCAYHTFESEKDGVVIICGCWMHARRRWAESLRLRNVKGMTKEQIDDLPEAVALRLIGEIYKADQELKNKSAAERLAGRKSDVRQKVEAYFAFLESIDLEDPLIPERMKDAIKYSINQREYLTRFLKDASVPIDNGASERHIRNLAVGRNNWLFCTSTKGAEATAIMYSIVETARANGANVYYYLKYLLENAPGPALPPLSSNAMNELMPWSETYKKYEAEQKQQIQKYLDRLSDPEPVIETKRSLLLPKAS